MKHSILFGFSSFSTTSSVTNRHSQFNSSFDEVERKYAISQKMCSLPFSFDSFSIFNFRFTDKKNPYFVLPLQVDWLWIGSPTVFNQTTDGFSVFHSWLIFSRCHSGFLENKLEIPGEKTGAHTECERSEEKRDKIDFEAAFSHNNQ